MAAAFSRFSADEAKGSPLYQRLAAGIAADPELAALAAQCPLAMIEIGASGGFNLSWDRNAYDYGNGRIGSSFTSRSGCAGASEVGHQS